MYSTILLVAKVITAILFSQISCITSKFGYNRLYDCGKTTVAWLTVTCTYFNADHKIQCR